MTEKQYPPTKPVCQLDADGIYLHQTEADLDPLCGEGCYLLPAGCVDISPPESRPRFAARWLPEKTEWQYLPDHRGKTAYRTDNGQPETVTQIGELPAGLTLIAPPSGQHTWDGKQWVLDATRAAELKAAQQDEMWERIKAKRYDNLRHGVFAKSVGKWFQTDDPTRLQYLALSLEAVTGGFKKPIRWKTMDNTFLMLTPELLREIMQTMHDDEEADFVNAEKHKAAMLKAERPLEYDFSGGWIPNFESAAAELEGAKS